MALEIKTTPSGEALARARAEFPQFVLNRTDFNRGKLKDRGLRKVQTALQGVGSRPKPLSQIQAEQAKKLLTQKEILALATNRRLRQQAIERRRGISSQQLRREIAKQAGIRGGDVKKILKSAENKLNSIERRSNIKEFDRLTQRPKEKLKEIKEIVKEKVIKKGSLERFIEKNIGKRKDSRTKLTELQSSRKDLLTAIVQERNRQIEEANKLSGKARRDARAEINRRSTEKMRDVKSKFDKTGIKIQGDLLGETGAGILAENLLLAKTLGKFAVQSGKKVVTGSKKFAEDKKQREETLEIVKKIPKFTFDISKKIVLGSKKFAEDKKTRQRTKLAVEKFVTKQTENISGLIKNSPAEAFLIIGTEIALMAATDKGLRALETGSGKIIKSAKNKILNLNPKLIKVVDGIATVKKGEKLIKLKIGGVKDFSEPLSKQLKRGGKKALAVTSQANKLVGLIRRKKVIRKPIPGEDKLKKETLKLLRRFDRGKVSQKEFFELQKQIRQQTISAGQPRGVDLLERSLFFDPQGGLRASRLAIAEEQVAEGTFLDLLRGKATLKKAKAQKPQILVLEEFIEKIPKTKELKPIIDKLKKNKPLTNKELTQLSTFQVTPSGKLKPIGSTTFSGGIEREVTLAPTEAIKRVKKLGTLKIDGKRIPIVLVKVAKGKTKINLIKKINKTIVDLASIKLNRKKLLEKLKKSTTESNKKNINKKLKVIERKIKTKDMQVKKLNKKAKEAKLEEFLKAKKDVRRIAKKGKKVFKARRKILSRASRARIKKRITKRAKPRATARTQPRPVTRKAPRVTSRGKPRTKITPRKTPVTKRKVAKRVAIKTVKGKKGREKRFRIRVKRKPGKTIKEKEKNIGYNVKARPIKRRKGQKKPKLLKVNKKPLTKSQAENLRNYVADTSLARTAKITPTKSKAVKSKLKIPVAYAARSKNKFRTYKIVKGKRVPLAKGKVIERRGKPLIDTRQEKAGITLRRRIAQIRKPVKRKLTSKQLSALKKGRAKLKRLKK